MSNKICPCSKKNDRARRCRKRKAKVTDCEWPATRCTQRRLVETRAPTSRHPRCTLASIRRQGNCFRCPGDDQQLRTANNLSLCVDL